MKKIFFIMNVVFLLIISISATAQYSIGIDGGAGIGNAIPVYNNGLFYNYGIFGKVKISNLFYTKGKIAFESTNSSDNIIYTDINGEQQNPGTIIQTFQFLSFSALVGINVGNRVNYFFNAGPYLGYLLKQNATFEGVNGFFDDNLDNTNNYKRYGFGLLIGAGVEIPLSEKILLAFGVRHNLLLTNLSKVEGAVAKICATYASIGFAYAL